MEKRILILYDLSSKTATRRIPRILFQYNSVRIQKSVFSTLVNEKEEKKLWDKLTRNIDLETDKLLWIPITDCGERMSVHVGRYSVALEKSKNFICI